MRRRDFMTAAAAAPLAAALPAMAAPRPDVATMKTRKVGKVEIVYNSPHTKPNGLQATPQGLWVLDQGSSNMVTLVNYADGKVIRDFAVDMEGASGVTVDADNVMWCTSTHNSLIVTCSPEDGKTIAKYWTPGAGRIYAMAGDPPAARSPLPPAKGANTQEQVGPLGGGPGANGGRGGRGRGSGLPAGQLPTTSTNGLSGTGAHGIENRDGLLYFANPPARHVYVMEPRKWVVQAWWPTPGNRPHGVAWDPGGDSLWVADSNWRAFFRHDVKTGEIVEKIQLTEKDPLIHGATFHDGYIWYCDDMGYICNFKLT